MNSRLLGRLAAATAAVAVASSFPMAALGQSDSAFGEPEKTKLVVAIPFPDITMYQKYYIADAEGYLADAGLEIEIVTADDTVAAVISGSADLGIQSTGAAILAADVGLDVDIVGGHSCRQRFSFATQPSITSAADLAGRDIVLAGTAGDPAQFERERVLKEAGWDVLGEGANAVFPGPDSATWREFFLVDSVALMPFYQDDLLALEEAGAAFPIDELKAWSNDVYVAKEGFAEANPNTLGRFFEAVMKGTDYLIAPAVGEAPANKDRIIEIFQANDADTTDMEATESAFTFGTESICPNLYYDEAAWNQTIETQSLDVSAAYADSVNLDALMAAQAALGLNNDPPVDIAWPPA